MLKTAARRTFLASAVALASALPRAGLSQEPAVAVAPAKQVVIFVQNAKSVTYDGGKLTLKGVGATTAFFADRPERVTGHMSTRAFIPFWKQGEGTFLKDPPQATLSFLGEGDTGDVVIDLRDPVLRGDDLSYSINVLQGDLPAKGGVASLFIDIVGMPTAPTPYASSETRFWRRRGNY